MKENLYPFFRYEIFTIPHTNPSDYPASGFLLFHHRALRSNMLRATSKQMEETLHAYPMLERSHRAFIVNLGQVEHLVLKSGSMQLVMKHSHDTIPISRINTTAIKEIIKEILRF